MTILHFSRTSLSGSLILSVCSSSSFLLPPSPPAAPPLLHPPAAPSAAPPAAPPRAPVLYSSSALAPLYGPGPDSLWRPPAFIAPA